MSFQYQKLGIPDIPLIQQVGRATYAPYYHHIWYPGGIDWYMEKCFGTEILLRDLADPNFEYLIPRDNNGEIVGFLRLILEKPTPDGAITNALYLEKIYLMPDYYGKGVGQKLMQFVFEKAAALGREAVWLTVMKSGPIQAYERAGFRVTGEEHWPYELLREEERGGLVMVRTNNPK